MAQSLLDGAVRFKNEEFKEHKELFKRLKDDQNPHTLFIGCSDSRVVPNLITDALPGELFVIRNIANIVPPYRVSNDFAATTSAIEYAIEVLNVENILVCGHSDCGGCAALYLPPHKFEKIPNVKKWLELCEPVKIQIMREFADDDEDIRLWHTEQLNIVEQMKHLLTYPFIRERFENGTLKIMGWYYVIATGDVYAYNLETEEFELIH